jgi:hypothetical protein
VPLSQPEVDRILHTATAGADRPRARADIELGESGQVPVELGFDQVKKLD